MVKSKTPPDWYALLGKDCFLQTYILTRYASLEFDEVALILNLSSAAQAQNLLQRGRIEGRDAGKQLENARNLLFVLHNALKKAGYEAGLMRKVMEKPPLKSRKKARQKPPWSEKGLLAYLIHNGPEGLTAAAEWIRNCNK